MWRYQYLFWGYILLYNTGYVGVCLHGTAQELLFLSVCHINRKFPAQNGCVSISAALLVKMSNVHELCAPQPCVLFDEICMTLAEL